MDKGKARSLEDAVRAHCPKELHINKATMKVRTSNWEIWPLSSQQVAYAARDAALSVLAFAHRFNMAQDGRQLSESALEALSNLKSSNTLNADLSLPKKARGDKTMVKSIDTPTTPSPKKKDAAAKSSKKTGAAAKTKTKAVDSKHNDAKTKFPHPTLDASKSEIDAAACQIEIGEPRESITEPNSQVPKANAKAEATLAGKPRANNPKWTVDMQAEAISAAKPVAEKKGPHAKAEARATATSVASVGVKDLGAKARAKPKVAPGEAGHEESALTSTKRKSVAEAKAEKRAKGDARMTDEGKAHFFTMLRNRSVEIPNLGNKEHPRGTATALGNVCVVVSGILDSFERKDFEQYVIDHGGKVSKAITGKVTHLVNDHGEAGPSKQAKCKEFGIPVVSENVILDLVRAS